MGGQDTCVWCLIMNTMKIDNTLPCLEPQSQWGIDYHGNEAHGGRDTGDEAKMEATYSYLHPRAASQPHITGNQCVETLKLETVFAVGGYGVIPLRCHKGAIFGTAGSLKNCAFPAFLETKQFRLNLIQRGFFMHIPQNKKGYSVFMCH